MGPHSRCIWQKMPLCVQYDSLECLYVRMCMFGFFFATCFDRCICIALSWALLCILCLLFFFHYFWRAKEKDDGGSYEKQNLNIFPFFSLCCVIFVLFHCILSFLFDCTVVCLIFFGLFLSVCMSSFFFCVLACVHVFVTIVMIICTAAHFVREWILLLLLFFLLFT